MFAGTMIKSNVIMHLNSFALKTTELSKMNFLFPRKNDRQSMFEMITKIKIKLKKNFDMICFFYLNFRNRFCFTPKSSFQTHFTKQIINFHILRKNLHGFIIICFIIPDLKKFKNNGSALLLPLEQDQASPPNQAPQPF